MIDEIGKLKLLRDERGLSLGDISKYFAKSKQWIYRLEGGDIDLTAEYKERYAQALNVHKDRLWLIGEDEELIVRPSQLGKLSKPLEKVTEGRAIRKMLTLRNKEPGDLPQTGYLLIPYLLEYGPGTNTLPHIHLPSLEIGWVISGQIKLSIGMVRDDGKTTYFEEEDLGIGDSYTISSSMPHFTQNVGKNTSLTLVVRLAIKPWEHTLRDDQQWITPPGRLPKARSIAVTNCKSIRMLERVIDWVPGTPGVPYHRHEWREQFIYVVSGGLKVKISPTGSELTPPVVYELEEGSAIHMDARLLHSLENLSDFESVQYIITHVLDFDPYGIY